jgi:uncharacterized protein YutD
MVVIIKDFFSIKLQKNYKKGEKVSFTKELEIHYIKSGCAKKVAKKTKEKKIEIKKK